MQKYIITSKLKIWVYALLFMCTLVTLQATVTVNVIANGPGTITKASGIIPFITMAANWTQSEDLTAIPDAGAVFSHWEVSSSELNYWSGNSTASAISVYATEDGNSYYLTAVFENSPVNVTVTSQSSAGIPIGNPEPTHGVNAIPLGTALYAGVRSPYPGNTGIRYNCTGFTGTGDFLPTSPNTNTTTTITQASTITWNWDTEFLLTLNTVNGGPSSRVDVSPAGRTWYKDGELITFTAQPAIGYIFVRWSGGPVGIDGSTSQTVSFNIFQPEAIAAVFEQYPYLSLDIISKDQDGGYVAGYSYFGDTTRFHTYNTLMDISVNPLNYSSNSNVREHCMGYTSTGGSVTPASLMNTETSGISPFLITANTTITLDWVREYKISLGIAGTTTTNSYDVSYLSYSPQRIYTYPPWFGYGDSVTISAASLTAGEVFLQWDSSPFGIDPYSPVNTFIVSGAADINARFASFDSDSDLDGMPNIWESLYGLDVTDPRNASEDPDNDGLSNLQEYIISQVLLAAGTVPTDISPIDADSDDDGMDDGYEYNHILTGPGAGTSVGESANALAIVSTQGDNGPNGNPDEDYHWNTNDGYENKTRGLLNIEEYYGPDNVAPYNYEIVSDPTESVRPICRAQENPNDHYDTSFSDTTDSEAAGGGDGFDDGFEYTWDQWQGDHAGLTARDPLNHVVPDRFGISGNTIDRRFNPAVIHAQDDIFGSPDYDQVYYIQTGSAVAWFTDQLEYSAYTDGGQTIGNYFIPQIIGGSSAARRSSHPFYWDTDVDQLPDGWEIAYGYDPWFVSTFGAINDADDDSDQDGQNNINEYIAGTNPTNKLSYFSITNLNNTIQDGCIITWPSVEGRTYDILITHDLKDNLFETLETDIFYPSGCYTDLVHWTEEESYYKVRVKIIE